MSVATSYGPAGYLSRYAPTGNRGLGDIFSDLAAAANAVDAYQQAGSIGPWLSGQVVQFRSLPYATLPAIRAQIAAVRRVLTANNVQSSSAGAPLNQADLLLNDVQQNYPAVSRQVDTLMLTLMPVLPKIYAGNYDNQVVSVLASNASNILSAIHGVNDALDKVSEAQQMAQNATQNPSLSADVRGQAMSALASASSMGWLKLAAAGLIGLVVVKAVMK